MTYFALVVTATATQAAESIHKLSEMAEANRANIAELGRSAPSVQAVHAAMLERPIVSAGWLVGKTGLTPATVNNSLVRLEKLGIIRQLGDNKRNRLFAYSRYMGILGEQT